MRWGIRVRIVAIGAAVLAAVLIVSGIALLTVQRRTLTDSVDESLDTSAAIVEAEVRAGTVDAVLTTSGDDDAVAQVVAPDGTVVGSTPNIAGRPPLAAVGEAGAVERRTIRLPPDEDRHRLRTSTVDGFVVHVGASLDDVDESVASLRLALLAGVPIVTIVLATMTWRLVGRTLRPVEAIRRQVADIGATSLDRRVPEPPSNDEISRLARTMNEMLARLERATELQRRFVADASHELRSPLTRLRTELEVDVAHPEVADAAATSARMLADVAHLQQLVDDLLHLARSDAESTRPPRHPVDLDDLALAEAARLRASSDLSIDTAGVTAVQTIGDAAQLARAVSNLGDNAARHAASRITLTTSGDARTARLTISDDGPGIPVDARERVFERFTRLDGARSAVDGGAGLGLAIARDIVERHDGTVIVAPTDRGASLVVSLPPSPADAGDHGG